MIKVTTVVPTDAATAWRLYTDPEHIVQWNQASDEWHCPAASVELEPGGRHVATMAAKDGSMSFDFAGTYTSVDAPFELEMMLDDDRRVHTSFEPEPDGSTRVTTEFEPEGMNSLELQQQGWQAILDSYARHVREML